MAWTTPTLKTVRIMVRDDITAMLNGVAIIGNSTLRVVADCTANLSHMCLRYLDWMSKQFLPDRCDDDWLDRHADIWLVNADGSVGRKGPSFAKGKISVTGTNGILIPSGALWEYSSNGVQFWATEQTTVGSGATNVAVQAVTPGTIGNIDVGETVALVDNIGGLNLDATVVEMDGGADNEDVDDLRARVLERIRKPPMGGDADDYVAWATSINGVTRAWCSTEMGTGTVMVRFMMDDDRAAQGGLPTASDVAIVNLYIQSVRPVTVKDCWVMSPAPEFIDFTIRDLDEDSSDVRAAIEAAVRDMLRERAAPAHMEDGVFHDAQTIYAAWVSEAISSAAGVKSFTLVMDDHEMPHNGNLAVLGTILYGT